MGDQKKPEVTLTFVSGKDDVAIAASIANHLHEPVVILNPSGTKTYVLPAPVGEYKVDHKPRGPALDPEDDLHAAMYDAPGG